MYYGKQFENKPKGYENAEVQKNLKQTEIEIKDLAEGLSSGATFKPALLNGTKSSDWIEQQIFALDFDHDTTIDEQINKCRELNMLPCFGYTSFSHSEQEHHFRLVFCTETVVKDLETRNRLQLIMISIFDKSDNVTKDPTRLFYGGRNLIQFDLDNRIDVDKIINTYSSKEECVYKNTQSKKLKTNIPKKDKSIIKHDDNMALKIEAIRTLNVEIMQQLVRQGVLVHTDKEGNISSSISMYLNPPPLELKSEKELYDYINLIDLNNYMGIYGYVNCILPDHNDSTPSAHIYKTKDGTQIYKCFGCDRAYTIISITEKLARCKRSDAIEFIKQVYNIKLIQTNWTLAKKQLLIDCANYLDSNDFKVTYPVLANLIRTRKHHIQKMLMHFTQYVNDDLQYDGKPLFFASYDTLMDVCGIKADRNQMSQSLTMFSLVDMIIKLQADQIPEKELTKARAIAAKYHHKKLTGFYSFNEYGTILFENSEEIAKNLKANNITFKGLSREYILRTFGTEMADKAYPQYKYENAQGTSQKSDERTSQIVECLFYCIDNKSYATEKDIVYMLGQKYSYRSTEIQIKKSLTEILKSYGLQRIRANRETKKHYCIDSKGYPFIIVRE